MGMTNKQTVATFINGKKEKGRSSNGTLFFEGGTLYSYGRHSPLAVKTDKFAKGLPILLVNSDNYSVTTAKHKSLVRSSALGSFYAIEVPHLLTNSEAWRSEEHGHNENHLIRERDREFGKLNRARADHLKLCYRARMEKLDFDLSVYRQQFMR